MSLTPHQQASRDQFDRQSHRYGRSHVLADTADLDSAADGLDLDGAGGEVALDIACGGGHTSLWLARRGYRVVCSDLSPRMLENTRALLASDGFDCEVLECPAEALPVESDSVRVVTCRVAAHHFNDPAEFVSECARVLEPGGKLVLIDGTVPDGNPEAAAWLNAVEKFRDPSHGRLVPPGEWTEICYASGFEILRCEVSKLKQPDLNWYFETASTAPENRREVLNLIDSVTLDVAQTFELDRDGELITWWWPRLHLVAKIPG